MTRGPQRSETRSEAVFRHTRQMLHERRISMGTFGQSVVEQYHARTQPDARVVEFKAAGDPFDVAKANAKKLERYMDGDVNARLPADLEEAWVFALMEPYRSTCLHDLAARYGMLDARLPEGTPVGDVQNLGRLTRELGATLDAMAPILEDGRIGPEDRALVPDALLHVDAILAQATAMRARLVAAGGGG